MPLLTLFSDLVSLVLGISSLVISIAALIISKKAYIYSSKEFIPKLDFTINNQHELQVTHSSQDLFRIEFINFVMVTRMGFWYNNNKAHVQIPFIVRSKHFRYIEDDGKAQQILITDNTTGPCAYGICPYDEAMVNAITGKIQKKYGVHNENSKGYAAPSMQGLFYTVEIGYSNTFNDRKSVIYKYEHYHGHGFDKRMIKGKELRYLLEHSNVPKFDEIERLWKYLIKKYRYDY